MMWINRIEHWGDRHHPAMFDLLRVVLGVFLFLKGFMFMQNMTYLKWIIDNKATITLSAGAITFIMYYTAFIHMVCGMLVMLGLLTRTSSLLQLPVVLGAIFFTDIFRSPLNAETWLSVFACVLLVIFSIIGSGPFSLDNFLYKISKK